MADLRARPSHILQMDIMNARYPIDVNVIQKITQSHGRVLRILIQRDQQQQPPAGSAGNIRALVELDSIDSADKARKALNGADIYSGCCTLNIDFFHGAKQLSVPRNTNDMCDFSRQGLLDNSGGGGAGQQQEPPGGGASGYQRQPYGATGGVATGSYAYGSRAPGETQQTSGSGPATATAAATAGIGRSSSPGAGSAYGTASAADPYGQYRRPTAGRGSPPPSASPYDPRYPPPPGTAAAYGAPPYADPYGRAPPYPPGGAPPYAAGAYPPRAPSGYGGRDPYAVDPYGRGGSDTLPPPQSNWPSARGGGRSGGRGDERDDPYGDYYGGRRGEYPPAGGPTRHEYGGPPPGGRPYPPRGEYGERNGGERGGGRGGGERGGRGGRRGGGFGDRGGRGRGGGGGGYDDDYGRGGAYGGGMPPGMHPGYYPPPVPPGYHHGGGGGGPGGYRGGEDNLGEIPVFYPPSLDGGDGCILIVYGLAEKFTCDMVFNLFSLYGNVIKIKFMKSKDGACMIQMSDAESARRCIACLNRVRCFEQQIEVCYSKQSFLHDVRDPFTLPNGSPSFKDFSTSKLNRYMTPDTASKNRITPPSRCLHFYNAPPYYTEAELMEIFEKKGSSLPTICTIINPRSEESKSGKPISGFVEWESLEGAVEAVVLANHHELPNIENPVHGFPYCFKLCFTQPSRRLMSQQGGGGDRRDGGERRFGGSGGRGGRGGDRNSGGFGRRGGRGGSNRSEENDRQYDQQHNSAENGNGENFNSNEGGGVGTEGGGQEQKFNGSAQQDQLAGNPFAAMAVDDNKLNDQQQVQEGGIKPGQPTSGGQ